MSGQRVRKRVFRVRRGRRAWAVPLLLVLAIVIVAALVFNLANLEPVGETVPAAPTGGEQPREVGVFLPDPIAIAVMQILAGVFLVGLVYLILHHRWEARRPRRPHSRRSLLATVLGLVLLVTILIAWPRAVQFPGAEQSASENATAGDATVSPFAIAGGWPLEVFLVLSVFGSLLWVLYRFQQSTGVLTRDSGDAGEVPEVRKAASTVVQETIRDLEIGEDVRIAILACFQRFCRLLEGRGITRQVALTPRELERLAVHDLAVSREASATLTSLFEEARYSEHPLGERDRTRAIESLGRIQSALEA